MITDSPLISGTIEQEGVTASFICRDHEFHFLPGKHEFSVYNQGVLKHENGFIRGRTHSGNVILIHSGNDIELNPTRTLNTWLYIIFAGSYKEKCSSIRFHSGVLNSLFRQQSLKISDIVEGEQQHFQIIDDSRKISINDDNVDYLKVFSGVECLNSIRKGSYVKSDGVYLDLVFKDAQPLNIVFKKYYSNIVALCQFMTFRNNISFDKIKLTEYRENDSHKGFVTIADCFVKPNNKIEKNRDLLRCITIDDLGENISNLYKLIDKRNTKKSKYCVNFIPDDKKDLHWITGRKIRDICTSIELEASLSGIEVVNNDAYLSAITEIKALLHSKKGQLTEKEYNYLKSTIDFCKGPAAELAHGLFIKHKQEVEPLLQLFDLDDLSLDDLQGIIKTRNTLTHGGGILIDENVANTSVIMMGVVYASILKRCCCKSEQIIEWFKSGLLTVA